MVDIGALGGVGPVGDVGKQVVEKQQKAQDEVSKFDQMLLEREQEGTPPVGAQGNQDLMAQRDPARIDLNAPVEKVDFKPEIETKRVTEKDPAKADNPLTNILQELSEGHNKLDRLIDLAQSDVQLSPQQLLAVQSGVHKVTQQLEMANKVIEQAVGAVKNMMQQQV